MERYGKDVEKDMEKDMEKIWNRYEKIVKSKQRLYYNIERHRITRQQTQ